MELTCNRPNCTVAQTGICLLNYKEPAGCPEREGASVDGVNEILSVDLAPLEEPAQAAQLPASHALTLNDAATLMSARYCHMIGIVGSPDAGKTAALASLYLLLSSAKLKHFDFADSRTLMALDEIARGARRWNRGQPPEQMTAHTVQADARAAGLLHIRLRSRETGDFVDLLLPDLPGEWSTSLIDTNRADRFDFLKSADCVWVMVDGRQLREVATRRLAAHRTTLLIKRLSEHLRPNKPKIKLVLTRRDAGEVPMSVIEGIAGTGRQCGFELEVVEIASFADGVEVNAGHGIEGLILSSVAGDAGARTLWSDHGASESGRWILNYRREEQPE
ncbi:MULTISPECIES: TRAFAC clade GTPase domain-containing protein [Burkholderia]|uniref:TRAFAC clade GTPase domain-containing protein n=1 Tax=Burkholderia TaxID=32008 RepID=UPI000AA62C56|nr:MULTISPECIES: hypothetical protein [Burkholderia]